MEQGVISQQKSEKDETLELQTLSNDKINSTLEKNENLKEKNKDIGMILTPNNISNTIKNRGTNSVKQRKRRNSLKSKMEDEEYEDEYEEETEELEERTTLKSTGQIEEDEFDFLYEDNNPSLNDIQDLFIVKKKNWVRITFQRIPRALTTTVNRLDVLIDPNWGLEQFKKAVANVYEITPLRIKKICIKQKDSETEIISNEQISSLKTGDMCLAYLTKELRKEKKEKKQEEKMKSEKDKEEILENQDPSNLEEGKSSIKVKQSRCASFWSYLKTGLINFIGSSRGLKNTGRATIAFFLASLVSYVSVIEQDYAPYSSLTIITVLLADFSTSVGVIMESTILLCLGGSLGIALSIIIEQISFDPYWLYLALFFSMFGFTYMRAKYPFMNSAFTIASFLFILNIVSTSVPSWISIWQRIQAILTGAGISFVCTIIFWPISASSSLNHEIIICLTNISSLLELSTKIFLHESEIVEQEKAHQLLESSRTNFDNLSTLLEKAKFEFSFDYLSIDQKEEICNSLQKLIQHLNAIYGISQVESISQKEILELFIIPLRHSTKSISKFTLNRIYKIRTVLETHIEYIKDDDDSNNEILHEFEKSQQQIIQKLKDYASNLHSNAIKMFDSYYIFAFTFNYLEFIAEVGVLTDICINLKREKVFSLPERFTRKKKVHTFSHIKKEKPKKKGIREFLHNFSKGMGSYEVKYGLKCAIAIILIFIFEQIISSIFHSWRAEWIMITVVITITPNLGGSFINSFYQITGTIVGGIVSIIVWLISDGNPIILTILSTLFLGLFSHIRLNTSRPKLGLISLLTYIIVVYSAYLSIGIPGSDSIYVLAYKRMVTITLGVIITLIISRLFWPFYARVSLRQNLSEILHDFAGNYGSIVSSFIKGAPIRSDLVKSQTLLQLHIIRSKALLLDADSEPKIKGPFQYSTYAGILKSCQTALNYLVSMRLVTTRRPTTLLQDDLMIPLHKKRKFLSINMILLLHMLSATFAKKAALPSTLPPVSKIQFSLTKKLIQLPFLSNQQQQDHVLPYIYFFAYASAHLDLAREVENIALLMKSLFGEEAYLSPKVFQIK